MKTLHLLLIVGFVALGIVHAPAPSIPFVGRADIAIKGADQGLHYQPVSAKTYVVRGVTNVVTVQESTATNITLNADSLLALLANSFSTNFPVGTQLLLYGSQGEYSLVVSDATGTNASSLPIGSVLISQQTTPPIHSGMQTELITNQVFSGGNDTEAYTSVLTFDYDDAFVTPHDGTQTIFFLNCLVEAKSSRNLKTLAGAENVNMTLTGGGQIRNQTNVVVTGTIKAKLIGRPIP